MSRGLKNPIRSMFNSAVRGVVSDYNREWRMLDRIRDLETRLLHATTVQKQLTRSLTDMERILRSAEIKLESLEKILVKQNT